MIALRAFLASVNPKVWGALVLVVVTAAYTMAVYHAGGVAPRAEVKQLRAKIAADGEAQKAQLAKQQKEHEDLVKKKDAEHEDDLAAADAYWSAELDRLQQPAGSRAAKEPVPIAAKICDDPTADGRLSVAVAIAQSDTRAAIDEFRQGIAGLLRACEVQTRDLVNLQDWVAHELLINAVPDPAR